MINYFPIFFYKIPNYNGIEYKWGRKIMDEEKAYLGIFIIMSYLRDYIFSYIFMSIFILLFNSPYNMVENVMICAVLSVIPTYRVFEEIMNDE
jgi:hypothetical protein